MPDRRSLLAGAAALTVSPVFSAIAGGTARREFPRGFLWGASTAGHQVEGNNSNSDVWFIENVKPSSYTEPSADAANSFELWPTDLDLVKGMGLNTYRFSLEWARIEPEPGLFSLAMLDHYQAMIAGCRARGLTPIVTFNHFTCPRWFAMRGGWGHGEAPALFARFCDRAARHLAGEIGYALTLNEPNLAGKLQNLLPGDLISGDKAACEAAARATDVPAFQYGNALYIRDLAATQTHLMEAHRQACAAIKAVRGDLPVGTSLAILDDQAAGSNSLRNAKREYYYGEWLRLVRADDFVAIQNYERSVWTATGKLPTPAGTVTNMLGGEVYPPSLANVARYAHAATGLPVLVTEHGVCTDDDTIRARFIPAALAELKRAMDEGVPVLGYCHWSLVDNFEWGFGYRIHYGLHSLDRQTFQRTAKPSAAVLGGIARANALPL